MEGRQSGLGLPPSPPDWQRHLQGRIRLCGEGENVSGTLVVLNSELFLQFLVVYADAPWPG